MTLNDHIYYKTYAKFRTVKMWKNASYKNYKGLQFFLLSLNCFSRCPINSLNSVSETRHILLPAHQFFCYSCSQFIVYAVLQSRKKLVILDSSFSSTFSLLSSDWLCNSFAFTTEVDSSLTCPLFLISTIHLL